MPPGWRCSGSGQKSGTRESRGAELGVAQTPGDAYRAGRRALERDTAQPGPGHSLVHRLVKWTPILTRLTSSSSRKWCSRNSESWASAFAEPRRVDPRVSLAGPSGQALVASRAVLHLLGPAPAGPGSGRAPHCFRALRKSSAPLHFSSANVQRKRPTPSRATRCLQVEAPRGRWRRPRGVADGGLLLGRIAPGLGGHS